MSAPRTPDLTSRIAAGDFAGLEHYCTEQGMGVPKLIWTPTPDDLELEPLRFLLDYWHCLRDGDGLPCATGIDPVDMRPVLGNIMLLDVLDDGADFHYRLYGSNIAERAGFDMTGKRVSDIKTGAAVATFFGHVYRAVLKRRDPIYTQHQPPVTISVAAWFRLILPLVEANGRINRLLVGNIPGDWRSPQADPTKP